MKEQLFSFTNNGIEYFVMKKNDEYIPYKKVKGTITYDLSTEEYKLIDEVFNGVKVTNNVIRLENFETRNKQYLHFFDKTNQWNLFFNLDGTSLNKKEFNKLNMMFNYQDDILYDAKEVKKNSLLKRIVTAGGKTFVVLVTSTMLISPFAKLTPAYAKNVDTTKIEQVETKKEAKEEQLTKKQKIKKLRKAVLKNKNLNDKEKAAILSDFEIVIDYIDYLNYDYLMDVYKNMKIQYSSEPDPSGKAAGYWNGSSKIMFIYGTKDIDAVTNNYGLMGTYHHERSHVNQDFSYGAKDEYKSQKMYQHNSGFFEPMTSMMPNEYEEEQSYGYQSMFCYTKALFKIVSRDTMIYTYFTNDYSRLYKELQSLINDEAKSYQLINTLNAIYYGVYNKTDYSMYRMKLINIIADYYQAKYNKSMYEDVDMVYYFDEDLLKEYINAGDKHVELETPQIYYFNKQKIKENKDKNQKMVVTIYGDKVIEEVEIAEASKYLLDNNYISQYTYNQVMGFYEEFKKYPSDDAMYEFRWNLNNSGDETDYYNCFFVKDEKLYCDLYIDNKEYIDDNLLKGKGEDIKKQLLQAEIKISDEISVDFSDDTIIYNNEKINASNLYYITDALYKGLNNNNIIEAYVRGNILTVIVDYRSYNYDLATKAYITLERMLKDAGLSKQEVVKAYKDYVTKYVINSKSFRKETGNSKAELKKYLERTIAMFENDYINSVTYDENGDLLFIAPVYYRDGDSMEMMYADLLIPSKQQEQVKSR